MGGPPPEELEKQLRGEVKALVQKYYEKVHKPHQETPFVPGRTKVNYAGRVFDDQEMLHLTDALLDFWLTSGRFCDEFEKKFAERLGVKYSLLVNSGSSANLVAFSALTSHLLKERRIQKGDEVITVAAGFPTTLAPIIQYGAIPVFIDVTLDDGTYNADVSLLEAALGPRTKAVMLAHTLGNPFRLSEVMAFCKKHNLWLIEDNCDALGSTYGEENQWTGTFGDLATSSFYPPHHMTMGEGGAVYTSNTTLKRAAESFRDWGRDCWCASGKDNTCKKRFDWQLGDLPRGYDHKYIYSHWGYNLKATEMQAAIGCAQLEKLGLFTQKRRENYQYFFDHLKGLEEFFILPKPTPGAQPSWFGFLLTLRPETSFSRKDLTTYLEERGVQTRMLFAGNILRHPVFSEMKAQGEGYRVVGELKNTEAIAERTFWFGLYPGLKPAGREWVVESIYDFIKKGHN